MEIQRKTKFVDNLMRPIALKYLCPAHACFLIDIKMTSRICSWIVWNISGRQVILTFWVPGWLSQFIGQLWEKQPLIISAGGNFSRSAYWRLCTHCHFAHPLSGQSKVVAHGLFWLTRVVLKVQFISSKNPAPSIMTCRRAVPIT